jgi:hypothetical protein
MSGYTMTQTELLYSVSQASTPVTTPTVSPGASMIPGLPPITVPAGYMQNSAGTRASSLKLDIWGFLTATATIPSFGFSLYSTSASPAVWAATNLLATATTTNTPTATAGFHMEWHISYRTVNPAGSPATGVVICYGRVECPTFVSPFMLMSPPAGTLGNFTAWDANVTYYLWPTIFCGAATASNFVTTEIVKLYGEN